MSDEELAEAERLEAFYTICCEARRARAAEERLRGVIKGAPHADDCPVGQPEAIRKGRIVSRAKCACFKSRAEVKE
jgi:hypothetical protein